MAVQVQVFNLEGVMEAFFREFISQPGERQHFSQLLHSIRKGEPVGDLELLSLPAGCDMRLSPRSSPHGSPLNPALLSPLFLPHSPRSPLTGGHCGALRTPTSSQSRFSRTYNSPHSPLARAVFKTVSTSQNKNTSSQDAAPSKQSTSFRATKVTSPDERQASCIPGVNTLEGSPEEDRLSSVKIPIPLITADDEASLEILEREKNIITGSVMEVDIPNSNDGSTSELAEEKIRNLVLESNSLQLDAIGEAANISGKSSDTPCLNNDNKLSLSGLCAVSSKNDLLPTDKDRDGGVLFRPELNIPESIPVDLVDRNEVLVGFSRSECTMENEPEQEKVTGVCRVTSEDGMQSESCDQFSVVSCKSHSESMKARVESLDVSIGRRKSVLTSKPARNSKKDVSASVCASDLSKASVKAQCPSLSNPRVNAALVSSLIAKFNSLEPDHCQSSISNVKESSEISQVPSRVSCLVSQANCDGRFKGGRDSFECDKENLVNVTDDAKKQSVMQSSLRQLGLQDSALREKSLGHSPKSRAIRSVRSPPSEVMVPSIHSKPRGSVSPPKIFVPLDTQTKPKTCSVPFNVSEKYISECPDGPVNQRFKNKPRRRDYQALSDPTRTDDRKKRQVLILDDETVLFDESTVPNDLLNAGFICSDDSTVSETVHIVEPTCDILHDSTPVSVGNGDSCHVDVDVADQKCYHGRRNFESQSVNINNVINVTPVSRNGRDCEEKRKLRESSTYYRNVEAFRTSTPTREMDACPRPLRRVLVDQMLTSKWL
ncbi:hypothetical protein FHG87_000449 [Trinorchestia longiramus]|nr:hypothetical protein FHG87_000449 [Trinorchestia longiramus]